MPKFKYLGDFTIFEEAGKQYAVGDDITLTVERVAQLRSMGRFRFERVDSGDDDSLSLQSPDHTPTVGAVEAAEKAAENIAGKAV